VKWDDDGRETSPTVAQEDLAGLAKLGIEITEDCGPIHQQYVFSRGTWKKEGESMLRKFVIWSVLLVAGFLIGFILQYESVQRAQQELSASTKQLGSCQSREQLSQLRDTATMMYLEVVQKNYGKAGEHAKEFFDQAQRIGSSAEDPALQNLLRDILASRDQITGDLAKGDAAALSEIQPVLLKLEQTAKPRQLGTSSGTLRNTHA
jgi:hypothetical protein